MNNMNFIETWGFELLVFILILLLVDMLIWRWLVLRWFKEYLGKNR